MKYLKMFESWYDEYSYEFSDKGFELTSQDGVNKILIGKYKGEFLITNINDYFGEMILRMSDDYNVLRTKTYFNPATGNANFSVELSDKFNEDNFIIINKTDGDIKWFPIEVNGISNRFDMGSTQTVMIISGRIESGESKSLTIHDTEKGLEFSMRGFNTKRPKLDNENVSKLIDMIDDGTINSDGINGYEDLKKSIISKI